MTYGLTGFGAELGKPVAIGEFAAGRDDDLERILGYGYRRVRPAAEGTGLTDLATGAANAALAATGLGPEDVDLFVLACTDITEYLYWDAAASVTARLGAVNAEAVLLTQACTTGVVALDVVAGRFATHPRYESALIVAANRVCEPYWDRLTTQSMVFSDGAVAAVARRGHARLRWRATEVLTDGRYADLYRMAGGGAAAPFHQAAKDGTLRADDAWSVLEHFRNDLTCFHEFVRLLDDNSRLVVHRACERAGATVAEVARLCAMHDNAEATRSLATVLDIDLGRTNAGLAADHGHLGAADPLFGLADLHARGQLSAGDLVALFARGRGMHWACSIIEA